MRPSSCLAGILLVALATPAAARVALYEDEDVQLYYGGYLRSFTAWQTLDDDARGLYALQGLSFGDFALQSVIGRTEFKLSAGDWFTADVHSRYAWTLATQPILTSDGAMMGAGAGVSVAPRRSLDLSSSIVAEPKHTFEADVDRLVLRFYLGDVDLSVGRQAVTWGHSNLFTVSDVWSAFSPFDLDTSQKRGIDAVRAVWAVTDTVELDVIVADRGSVDDLSGGVRTLVYLDFGELYVAAAKTYEDLALAAGLSADIDTVKLRGEVMARFDTERSEVEMPRATLGVDWFQSDSLMVGAEVHLNGFGTSDTEDMGYLLHASQEAALGRGEGYLLGLLYAGSYATYRPHHLLTLSGSVMMNLLDPTALLTWSATLEVMESVDLGLGGFHGVGDGAELGLYGHLGYFQLAAFF